MLLPSSIHPSWSNFLTKERIDEIEHIEQQLGHHFNPTDKSKTLRFLELDLQHIKVVWLGQDVYPAKDVATGRAFEAGNISSWCEPFKQVSLKNILRLIHKTYHNITIYEDILPYSKIKEAIQEGTFKILEFKQWFDALEKQGVLFLNTSFTCNIGEPNSHKHLWINFSNELMTYIANERPDLIWFLWGNEAISKQAIIHQGLFYTSRHPMMCSQKYEHDFLKSNCFQETRNIINWLG